MPALSSEKRKISLSINLLPEGGLEKTAGGKFIKWALSVGRYIVVFTEFIVILAFLSRFKFDREVTDIYESVEQKKAIVASATGLEKDIRNLADRLEKINKVSQDQKPYSSLIAFLSETIPEEVTINNLTITGNTIFLSCQSQTPKGIGSLIYQLKSSPKLTEISLGTVNRKSDQPIKFTVTAILTKEALKNEN